MRIYGLFALLFICFTLASHASVAQEVKLRNSAHDGYGRLVLEPSSRSSYEITTPSDTTLRIEIPREADIQRQVQALRVLQNIQDVRVVSSNPVTLEITIPKGSRTRHLAIGKRIILDVYDPPSGATTTQRVQSAAPKETVAPTPKDEPAPKQASAVPAVPAEEVEAEKLSPELEAFAMQSVSDEQKQAREERQQEERNRLQQARQDFLRQQAERKADPVVITWAATRENFSAAFDDAGQLFIYNQINDAFVFPKIVGKDSGRFAPANEIKVPDARMYQLNLPEDYGVDAEGGGLSWRLVASPDGKATPHVRPVRQNDRDDVRLFWPMAEMGKLRTIEDPLTGMPLFIVPTANSQAYGGAGQDYPDFTLLNSHAGLAIRAKVDDLEVQQIRDGVVVSRPGGLRVLRESDQIAAGLQQETGDDITMMPNKFGLSGLVYNFEDWKLGDLASLDTNKNIILGAMDRRSRAGQVEDLITIAKMHLAHARGPEALGFFNLVEQNIPDIVVNPEFLALRGVANALSGRNFDAFKDLFDERLQNFGEINFWKAYVLAHLEDWQQAAGLLPTGVQRLAEYPANIRNPLVLQLAEVALRAGDVQTAEELLDMVAAPSGQVGLDPWDDAALKYLLGEAARQRGNTRDTVLLWQELVEGRDDLYRTRAGLALSRLQSIKGEVMPEEVVDRLESLRYGWRGDSLEARINFWLGKAYFETDQYIKGLNIMREAATLGQNEGAKQRIAESMTTTFQDLFLTDDLRDVPPFEAIGIYEQFSELIPQGQKGIDIQRNLAEHLARSNLLDKAVELFTEQFEEHLKGFDAARIGTRIAVLQLLDDQPEAALEKMAGVQEILRSVPASKRKEDLEFDLGLLRARALSKSNRADQAIALLEDMGVSQDVNRLRADIAWESGYWEDAAHALGEVILDEDISLTRPLNPDQANMILSRAVALNLASDRIALANLREKFSDPMRQTTKGKLFEVITRPRKTPTLADRETLMSVVSEVDLFSNFLDGYRNAQPVSVEN